MAVKPVISVKNASPREKPYEIRGGNGLILRIQPTGRKTFYVQVSRGKRQRIGNAEVITLARAQYRAREILNEAADGRSIKRDPVKSTLGGFIEKIYTPWVQANRKRANTCLSDLSRCFGAWYERRITDIAAGDLNDYVARRRAAGRSSATVVRDLNNLRSVMTRAIAERYLRDNPFADWEKPKVDDVGVTRYLSVDEESRLREVLHQRDDVSREGRARANVWRAERGYELLPEIAQDGYGDHLTPMVLLSLNTGMRYGELTGIEWPAVDMTARVITVVGRTAKGNKTRHIPLNAEAYAVLTRWRGAGKARGLVFSNAKGKRIGSVKTAWQGVLAQAGVDHFRWHDLRHSFASKLVQRGVDLGVVRKLLGHADFKLTIRYAHLAEEQITRAVDALMPEQDRRHPADGRRGNIRS